MLDNLYLFIYIPLLLIGGFFSIQFFRGRMSWGRARRMGIPMAVFGWIIGIYYLALFESVYGFVGFILDAPVWIDILLFLVILVLSMAVYFKLIHREKFKPALFTTVFLVPLSIPGLHTAARLIPSKAPVEISQSVPNAAVRLIPSKSPVEISQSVPTGVPAKANSPFPQPKKFPQLKKIGDSGYEVEFLSSHEKGRFGDWLTARRLTAEEYKKLESKRGKIHGIDGVYVRYEEGNPQEVQKILIVENKVDEARLEPKTGQMTKEWIDEAVEKMLENDGTRRTGELIRENSDLVSNELWHHYLDKGSTVIHRLDDEANKVPGTDRTEHYIDNLVQKRCESKQPTIVCHPVSN